MKKYRTPGKGRKPPGRRIAALLSLLLVVATFFSAIPVHAEEFDSNGMGGGISDATSTASGSYKCVGDFEAAGYRFSMVGPTGIRVKDPYDVFEDGWVSTYAQSTTRFFKKKLTKLEIADSYTTYINTYKLTSYSKSNFYSNTYNKSDSDLGITLPSTAEKMATWGKDTSNIKDVVSALWNLDGSEVFSTMASNGWYLLIEPIYYIKAGGQYFAGTVTELALLSVADGTAYSSVSWTAVPSFSTDANSWAFISGYTHSEWPMSLHLESDISDFGMDAPSKTLSKTSRGTSKLIITEGYGVMAISASADDVTDSTLTIDPNGGTYNGVIITRQPGSVTVASGKTATVTFEATGDDLT